MYGGGVGKDRRGSESGSQKSSGKQWKRFEEEVLFSGKFSINMQTHVTPFYTVKSNVLGRGEAESNHRSRRIDLLRHNLTKQQQNKD